MFPTFTQERRTRSPPLLLHVLHYFIIVTCYHSLAYLSLHPTFRLASSHRSHTLTHSHLRISHTHLTSHITLMPRHTPSYLLSTPFKIHVYVCVICYKISRILENKNKRVIIRLFKQSVSHGTWSDSKKTTTAIYTLHPPTLYTQTR